MSDLELADIQTHVVGPAPTGTITMFNLGVASVIPMPPTRTGARMVTQPGFASLIAPQIPTNPAASKALYANLGYGSPIVLGVLDQTSSWPIPIVSGETLMFATSPGGGYVYLDSVGAVHLVAGNAGISILPSADISIDTDQHHTSVDALITTVNGLTSTIQTLLTTLATLTSSAGPVAPVPAGAFTAIAQGMPGPIT